MTFNPEKNSPVKINLDRLKVGLSARQMDKIKYECNLLKKDIQELIYIAPHLFTEGVTAANTLVIEEKKKAEVFEPRPDAYYDEYPNYYDDMG